jgi:hypothetical protein
VTALTPMSKGQVLIATIKWDTPAAPERVNTKNLVRVICMPTEKDY